MKKTVIGVVVVLAAALIGLKYFASRQQASAPAGQQPAQPQVQEGVALPAAPQQPEGAVSQPTESTYAPNQATGSYESLTLPQAAMGVKGVCEGGSIKDIMDNHGKTWGYFTGRRNAIEPPKTQILYDMVGDYYACVAASRQDITVCNDLPGEAEKDGVKVRIEDSPMRYCRDKAGWFLFKAFVSGKAPDQGNCRGYLADWDQADQARVSPADLCAAGAKGLDSVTAYMRERLPDYPIFERMMGFNRKSCGSDQSCLDANKVWEGIRTGNANACPDKLAPHCAALAQKTQIPCAPILMEMSKKYCGFYKDLLKTGRGFAGMTEAEVKEELRKQAEQKAQEEKNRKEQEVTTKEINTRVKQLLKKGEGD